MKTDFRKGESLCWKNARGYLQGPAQIEEVYPSPNGETWYRCTSRELSGFWIRRSEIFNTEKRRHKNEQLTERA